jgi:hypothetical protein
MPKPPSIDLRQRIVRAAAAFGATRTDSRGRD